MTTVTTRAIIQFAYSERPGVTLYHLFAHDTRAVALIDLGGVEMAAETWEVRDGADVEVQRYAWDVAVLVRLAYWVAPPRHLPRHLIADDSEKSAA